MCPDPFMGTGTTAVVAHALGRDYLGFDINKDYIKMANAYRSRALLFRVEAETPEKSLF